MANSEFNPNIQGRLAVDKEDNATKSACESVFKTGIRQMRYKLKQQYFVGIPADEIRTTSPVSYMTDEEWCKLVEKWSNARSKVFSIEQSHISWCVFGPALVIQTNTYISIRKLLSRTRETGLR